MKNKPKWHLLIILFGAVAVLCSCGEFTEEEDRRLQSASPEVVAPPPLKPGQILDPDSDYAKYWTGLPEWVDFNGLILKIPAHFTRFWRHKNYPEIHFTNSVERPTNIRKVDFLAFSFFMPDFGGYTPDNYLSEFNQDEIKVLRIQPRPMSEMEPGAPGSYPPNMFKRSSDVIFSTKSYQERYGLKCFEGTTNRLDGYAKRQSCYGVRAAALDEYILLTVIVPPYPDWTKFPIMQTTYFTKQYGGLEITWRAHAKHFNRWRDIDHQIWQYIKDWHVEE